MTMGISRRTLLHGSAAAGAVATLSRLAGGKAWADDVKLNVFAPLPPDPAPPGAAKFSEDAFAKWQQANGAQVDYELLAWPQLHDRMATAFASGAAPWDICYMCGWVPELLSNIVPYADGLSKDLVDDLPKSSFSTVTGALRSL